MIFTSPESIRSRPVSGEPDHWLLHNISNMTHNLQDPSGTLGDILREVSPIVRWCIVIGLVLGVIGYVGIWVLLITRPWGSPTDNVRQILPVRLLCLLFVPFMLGALIGGLAVGAAIEGIFKLLGFRSKGHKHKHRKDRQEDNRSLE